jgi:hypothetical protein
MNTEHAEPRHRQVHRAYWGSACTCVYGVRRAAPFNTVIEADNRDDAADMAMPGDVIVVSDDGGKTWTAEADIETEAARGH